MFFVLISILVVFLVFAYILFEKDVLSPSFMLIFCFLLSSIFAAIGNLSWGESLYPKTIFIIFLGILSMILGEFYARCWTTTFVRNNFVDSMKVVFIRTNAVFILIILQIVVFVLYYKRLNEIVSSIGYSGEYFLMYSRMATINYNLKLGTFFSIFLWVLTSGSSVSAYILILSFFKKIDLSFTLKILLMVSSAMGVFSFVLSGARYGLLQFVMIILFSVLYFSFEKNHVSKTKAFLGIVVLIFVVVEICAQMLIERNKSSLDGVFDITCIYMGSSIMALNQWANDFGLSNNLGEETFWGVRTLLNYFIPSVETTRQFSEFTSFANGSSTNIYTAYRAFLADFSWFGLTFISFLIGLTYSFFYKILQYKKSCIIMLSYAFFVFYLVYMVFTPAVTTNLLTVSQVMGYFWLFVIGKMLLRERL